MSLLSVNQLKKYFPLRGRFLGNGSCIREVDGVSFNVNSGETFALVGESGSGKTTVGFLVLGLLRPTEGRVYLKGQDIFGLRTEEMRRMRRSMQMVFQDPYGSLNPRQTVGGMLREVLSFHRVVEPDSVEGKIDEILELVGLKPVCKSRYPHEFSGGERQRIAIARAISLEPELIVADEPVSALDVSIRGQILNLLRGLQERLNLAYLFIAHDLAVVRFISQRVGVMYFGKLLEAANTEALFKEPLHPYTKALLRSIPVPDPDRRKRKELLPGEMPGALGKLSGCRFSSRCPYVMEKCRQEEPLLIEVEENHFAACHLYQDSGFREERGET
jgi:oligopeptide transport system ATP-binding protein